MINNFYTLTRLLTKMILGNFFLSRAILRYSIYSPAQHINPAWLLISLHPSTVLLVGIAAKQKGQPLAKIAWLWRGRRGSNAFRW